MWQGPCACSNELIVNFKQAEADDFEDLLSHEARPRLNGVTMRTKFTRIDVEAAKGRHQKPHLGANQE